RRGKALRNPARQRRARARRARKRRQDRLQPEDRRVRIDALDEPAVGERLPGEVAGEVTGTFGGTPSSLQGPGSCDVPWHSLNDIGFAVISDSCGALQGP